MFRRSHVTFSENTTATKLLLLKCLRFALVTPANARMMLWNGIRPVPCPCTGQNGKSLEASDLYSGGVGLSSLPGH
jgi:hypothetical protein